MFNFPWKRNKEKLKEKRYPACSSALQVDEVEIEIEGVTMRLRRKVNLDVPYEVSAFIPRAEIRRRSYEGGQLAHEEEILLNGITIVHAPRYPLAGESLPSSNFGKKKAFLPGPDNSRNLKESQTSNDVGPKINFQY